MMPTPFVENLAGKAADAIILLGLSVHSRDEFHPTNSQLVLRASFNDGIKTLTMSGGASCLVAPLADHHVGVLG
ncbi:MAG: hypothetical protein GY742_21280 [Hyphomicrobiales bacterium]|nr:hypothetical protein [Hyphomicrobiales bacterium]